MPTPRWTAALTLATLLSTAPAALATAPTPPLTLARAIELASSGNEIPEIAAARLAQARALRGQALSRLLPSLTVRGDYTRRAREVTRTIDDEEVTVQAVDALGGRAVVESTLFDLRALPLLRAADQNLEAQAIESTELRRALAFEVASAFYTVLSAEQLHDAARRRVEVAGSTAEESRIRLEAGLANRNDVTRSRLELSTADLEATRAGNAVTAARLALGFLLGDPVPAELVAPAELDGPAGSRDELVERALAASPVLAALARRTEAARQLAREPRLGLVPTLDLLGTWRWTNESGLTGRDEDWDIGVGLTWSIWDGGLREARGAQLAAAAREAELVLERERRALAVEIESALADLATAGAALEQARVQREFASQNAEEVRERFLNGLATALEQADALVAQFEADAALAREQFAVSQSRLALERAVGLWPAGMDPLTPTEENTP